MDNLQNHRQFVGSNRPTATELIKQLGQFDGSGEQLFVNLLAVQCFLGQAANAYGRIPEPPPSLTIAVGAAA